MNMDKLTLSVIIMVIVDSLAFWLAWKAFQKQARELKESLNLKTPANPNKSRTDMRHDIINAGFKMFRNVDTFWNTWEKQEQWHGPLVCWGVDFNNLIYHTPMGDYTMVRDLTQEEMERLVREIRKTDGLVDLLNSDKVTDDA